jgi:hypothetical protein
MSITNSLNQYIIVLVKDVARSFRQLSLRDSQNAPAECLSLTFAALCARRPLLLLCSDQLQLCTHFIITLMQIALRGYGSVNWCHKLRASDCNGDNQSTHF